MKMISSNEKAVLLSDRYERKRALRSWIHRKLFPDKIRRIFLCFQPPEQVTGQASDILLGTDDDWSQKRDEDREELLY